MRGLLPLLACLAARPALADEAPPRPSPPVQAQARFEAPPPMPPPPSLMADPPRWRLRLTVTEGFGGSRDNDASVARFTTTAELGARVWGPLSIDAGVLAVIAGEYDTSCGQGIRPSAIAGVAGVRADAFNGRAAPWVDPFVEVHGGVGAQAGAQPVAGQCSGTLVFGTGGARLGIDVWLGRAAVTVAVGFDYLPIGSTVAATLGGSFRLF